MKIRPVTAELLHEDGQTDTKKRIAAFRSFANASKNKCTSLPVTMLIVTLRKVTPVKWRDICCFLFIAEL